MKIPLKLLNKSIKALEILRSDMTDTVEQVSRVNELMDYLGAYHERYYKGELYK